MEFDLWYKYGSAPYQQVDISKPFKPIHQHEEPPIVLCETQDEADFLEGFQYVMGGKLDIRLVPEGASTNPWVYNRKYIFLTWNPIERI